MRTIKELPLLLLILFIQAHAQNAGHHTGVYHITERCENISIQYSPSTSSPEAQSPKGYHPSYTYSLVVRDSVVDSLITFSKCTSGHTMFPNRLLMAIVSQDSFSIYRQEAIGNQRIQGNGYFKEDSLFFTYTLEDTVNYYMNNWLCECMGKWLGEEETTQYPPDIIGEDKQWRVYLDDKEDRTGITYSLYFGQETTIVDKTYKEILCKKVLYEENYNLLPEKRWVGAMREEGSKLYYLDYTSGLELLMYDFSLLPGDELPSYDDFEVTAIGDTVLSGYSEEPLHFLKLWNTFKECEDLLVQGIGSLKTGIQWIPTIEWIPTYYHGPKGEFLCFKKGSSWELFSNDTAKTCLMAPEKETFTGIISFKKNPPCDRFENRENQLWATLYEENSNVPYRQMALMRNGHYFAETMVVDETEYHDGNLVEIEGFHSIYNENGFLYSDLEILTIRKLSEGTDTTTNYFKQGEVLRDVIIHPNPNKGKFYVETNRKVVVEVFSETGVLMLRKEISDAIGNREIEVSHPGFYIVRVTDETDATFTQKVVVK